MISRFIILLTRGAMLSKVRLWVRGICDRFKFRSRLFLAIPSWNYNHIDSDSILGMDGKADV